MSCRIIILPSQHSAAGSAPLLLVVYCRAVAIRCIWSSDQQQRGYTLNEKRLQQVLQNIQQLEQAVKLIQQSGSTNELSATEAKGLLDIITNYTNNFILLNQFDSNNLPDEKPNENIVYEIKYSEAVKAIQN